MRFCLIACKVFYREICACVARSPHTVDIHFLPQGLHDFGRKGMQEAIGRALSDIDQTRFDAILLAYGLCSNGVTGLRAGPIPLVIPRAHDCITLFMGSKEQYLDHFQNHPGTFYLTSGWLERTQDSDEIKKLGLQAKNPMGGSYAELVEKYGEKDARMLVDTIHATHHYRQITYIDMGIEPDDRFEKQARAEAEQKNWVFQKLTGDLKLLRMLVNGEWDETMFQVVPPGQKLTASLDPDRILGSEC
ncbi:MAG: DUF1638 domain-containing protein [bacterium]